MHEVATTYGLIGSKIAASLSPKIHEAAALKLGLPCRYGLFDLESSDELEDFLNNFHTLGGIGLNVTSPYKEQVATLLESDHPAVNLLTRTPVGWHGINSDGPAFEASLKAAGINDFSNIIFLGNGGVVSSILEHLGPLVQRATILRRSTERDLLFCSRFSASLKLEFSNFSSQDLHRTLSSTSSASILVLALSGERNLAFYEDFIPALSGFLGYFIDLGYTKEGTLLNAARSMGIRCQDGLHMLAAQAQIAQERWWGRSLPLNELLSALESKCD